MRASANGNDLDPRGVWPGVASGTPRSASKDDPGKDDPGCLRESGRACIAVSLSWGDTSLSVHHLPAPRSYCIGPDDACDLFVPIEYSRSPITPILLAGPGHAVRAVIPAGASACVQLPGQQPLELEDARARGLLQPCPDVDGASQVFLFPGLRVSIRLARRCPEQDTPYRRQAGVDDALVLTLAWVEELRWRNAWSLAALALVLIAVLGSAAAHAGALATIAYTMPALSDDGEIVDEQRSLLTWYAIGTTIREEVEPDPPPEWQKTDDMVVPGSVLVDEQPGLSGEMGERRGVRVRVRWGNMGPVDNPDPHLGLPGMREWQNEWWCAIYLRDIPRGESGGPSLPDGRDDALGVDPVSARGKNRGPVIGSARGASGIGRTGRNIGANARGDGAGALETGQCSDSKPVLLPGVPAISGPAEAQAIRPVVRQHLARFQSCYDTALSEHPSLRGRIMINAVIGADGQVESVRDGGSNLPAREVVDCVVQTFGTLVFPDVKEGPVSLSWPFLVADG